MSEFKKGTPVIWIEDDPEASYEVLGWERSEPGVSKDTRGTYDDHNPESVIPWVRLEDGRRVVARRSSLAPSLPTQPSDEEEPFGGFIDPAKVKAGDTVTLSRGNSTARGAVTHVEDFIHLEELGRYRVKGLGDGTRTCGYTEWTLTAHTPAPEPEPEWLFEFKGEEGPEGDEHWVRRLPSRTDALRSMIESANLDELNDFEGPVSFSVYTEETGPAEGRLVVIDPAEVDVEGLRRVLASADYGYDAQARAALEFLGLAK